MKEPLPYICAGALAPALSFSQFPRRPGMVPASFIPRPFSSLLGDLLAGCFSCSQGYTPGSVAQPSGAAMTPPGLNSTLALQPGHLGVTGSAPAQGLPLSDGHTLILAHKMAFQACHMFDFSF